MEIIGRKVRILSTNSLFADLSGKIAVICGYSYNSICVEVDGFSTIISLYKGEYELLD
jgi:hypothetical protein